MRIDAQALRNQIKQTKKEATQMSNHQQYLLSQIHSNNTHNTHNTSNGPLGTATA